MARELDEVRESKSRSLDYSSLFCLERNLLPRMRKTSETAKLFSTFDVAPCAFLKSIKSQFAWRQLS